MTKLKISAASKLGCVRKNNEDMVLVGDRFIRNDVHEATINLHSTDRYLVALADGMGGHNSGEVASSDVLHNLQFFFGYLPAGLAPGEFNEAIFEWLESITTIIDSKGHSEPRYHDMGTTLVAFAYYGGEFYWMNCGDSRLYHLHDGQLRQVSTDHSLSTLIGSTEHSNIITNCIGGGCKTSYIDMVKCTDDVQPGDVFLLCSDGLNDMLDDKRIGELLNAGADAEALCDAAIAVGGFDNVSTCVINIEKTD